MNHLWEFLKKASETVPDRIALSDKTQSITYQQYYEEAEKVADSIVAVGYADAHQPIGVLARHCALTPVYYLGILKSGNYYVPLDPEQPEERKQMIRQSSGMKLLISEEGIQTVDVPEIQETADAWNPYGEEDQPLYMIYTSGSTGVPKGVLKGENAMLDFIRAFSEAYPYEEHEIVGSQTPFYFDASAKDIYLSLYNMATLEILPKELFSFPINLVHYMNEKKITLISWVPSALSMLTKLDVFSEEKPGYLKKVFFVGEVFPMKQLNRWRHVMPDLKYVNLYGSSELAGVCCTYEIGQDEVFEESAVLPIGKPLPNCQVILVQDGKRVTEPGMTGEICVASKTLAWGYFGDREKTEKTFVRMKPDDGETARYLRTGDMASYDEKGNLVFASRQDHQIKHMGHRIELGEIEAMAASVSGIESCCCVYDQEKQKLVLFCESTLSGQEIKAVLRDKLSAYMVPGKIVVMDRLPLNANGKIDRIMLKNSLIKSH